MAGGKRAREVRGRGGNGAGKRLTRARALRVGLALGLVALALPSIAFTLSNVIVKAAPHTAYSLAPFDGRVAAAVAQREFTSAPDTRTNSDQARLAHRALLLEPTSVDALNVLAMQAEMRQDQASADILFDYSFSLSRRELQPQIWSIEKAVERGDIEQALSSYDLALRTSRSAHRTLFPVLASALIEPKVRIEVLRLLARQPIWAVGFLDYASSRGRSPAAVAKLLQEGGTRLPITDTHRAQVVNGLAAQGRMLEAWDFFTIHRNDRARDRSGDPNFEHNLDRPSVFDWSVGNAPGLSVVFGQGNGEHYLEFSVPSSKRVVVVKQTLLLPQGSYKLEGSSSGIEQPERSLPYWSVACQGSGELERVDVANSTYPGATFSGEFRVPAGCEVQTLSLIARASDKVSGVFGRIERAQVTPLEG